MMLRTFRIGLATLSLATLATTAAAQGVTSVNVQAIGTSTPLYLLPGTTIGPAVERPLLDISRAATAAASLSQSAPSLAVAPQAITPLALTLPPAPTPYQTTLGNLTGVTISKNFPGLGRGFNANWTDQFVVPPSPAMAVGPNHIVQWVNVRLTVMDKNGTPLVGGALGYINGNAIWNGLPPGSVCRETNQGDPVAQYDRRADRFILSQFAFNVNSSFIPIAPFARCIAVSTTNDPTGTYALYEYQFDALPDTSRLGVWTDSYLFTSNDFTINPTNGSSIFVGARVCAYDRAAMLAGTAATQVCSARQTNRFAMLPSDIDGATLPPAGAAAYVISNDWFFFSNAPYSYRLQRFKPDFVNPGNSTFDDGLGGAVNSFVGIPFANNVIGPCGDMGGQCVPQPGTPRVLDTLSMRPQGRLAYRNRAGVESLVVTQTTDAPSVAVASTHWMEIRDPGSSNPQVWQSAGISTPDGLNRWIGAAAMDKAGNIALGYSVSSATVSPGVRIAGRYRTDIRNTLRGELNIVSGTGAQTSTVQRWGNYSVMQIDPVDDCTFWYTQQYMQGTFARDWSTRIAAFRFPNCTP